MTGHPLYHHCAEYPELREMDLVEAGVSSYGRVGTFIRADFDNCTQLMERAAAFAQEHKNPAWQQWFASKCPSVNGELLATVQAFTAAFEPQRKLQRNDDTARSAFYGRIENTEAYGNLSEAVSNGHAQCVEIAMLAKHFFDLQGIYTTL